ncbi:MAG TPA: aldo/keto reductase [Candidatus Hydrogenedentes bacterium]|nr:aldo/keto reductase [Candidatus Hydrogenedentota bacterium]
MKYRNLGSSGISASVVGMGTWVTGGGPTWGAEPDDRESVRAIHAAIDMGVNLIDTAPLYGFGRSETVVGKAIQGKRDQVVLATKCGLWTEDDRGSFFTDYEGVRVMRSLRPDTIRIEVERSLQRIGTDVIDLYQTHWPAVPPDKTPIADTMACLLELRDEGKIRAIGVSNVSLEELQENAACGPVASNQFRYSMLYREPEADILPFCLKNNIATLTYMSLEQGLLTGKVGMDREFAQGEWRSNADWNPWFKIENRQRVLDLLSGWNDLTEEYHCSFAQLMVAWTAAQAGVTHVLCGARTADQIMQTAEAGDLDLEPADVVRMRDDVEALGDPA